MIPLLPALSLLLTRQAAAQAPGSNESTAVVWRSGAPPYVLRLTSSTDSDSETGPRLSIRTPRGRTVVVSLPGGLVPINRGLADPAAASDNLIRSTYLYLTPRLRDAQGTPLLLAFGWAYASDPGGLVILALTPHGEPAEVFRSKAFELTNLVDLDGDGAAEIVGRHTLGEKWGRCFETYDPYSVYRLIRSPTPRAVYDTALSRAYNIAHYFGWAGPKAREDLTIVRCAPDGPRIMDKKRAEHLFDHP